MVSGCCRCHHRRRCHCCCCVSLCVKMSPLIQPPPLPFPEPFLCLLSLFVSEMIPSVMSKATLSYSCCLGNQRRADNDLKPLQGLKLVNMKGYLQSCESWKCELKGSYCWNLFMPHRSLRNPPLLVVC